MGEWIDATTGELFTGQYHFGHKPQYQWKMMQEHFQSNFWTQEEVNDFMNNPLFYQTEKPANNVFGLFDHY